MQFICRNSYIGWMKQPLKEMFQRAGEEIIWVSIVYYPIVHTVHCNTDQKKVKFKVRYMS